MELDGGQRVVLRIGALIVSCTLVLTAGFVGLIATVEGAITGWGGRFPWYLVGAAICFVAIIVLLELNDADGRTIMVSALVVGALSFVLLFLSVEGVIFTAKHPEAVIFDTRLVLYFFAAALVATGIGYWGLRHWREFTQAQRESL